MSEFSKLSQSKLETCHPLLQDLFNEVIKHYDCTVICGHRSMEDQEEAFRGGKSKKRYPSSKHNLIPAMAVDVVPYPVDWNDFNRFYHFGGFVLAIARIKNIPVRWGGDFNQNGNLKDDKFIDMPHWELVL